MASHNDQLSQWQTSISAEDSTTGWGGRILVIVLGCVLTALVNHWRAPTRPEEDTSRRWTVDPEIGRAIRGEAASSTSRVSRMESLREQAQAGLQEIAAELNSPDGTIESVSMISSNHVAVNEKGELIDRWGTPFFLHQLSARQMEIRSAGPDREMWTEDDVEAGERREWR